MEQLQPRNFVFVTKFSAVLPEMSQGRDRSNTRAVDQISVVIQNVQVQADTPHLQRSSLRDESATAEHSQKR